jgi:L-seryl-tRNA(Ser) seleniumtransferase
MNTASKSIVSAALPPNPLRTVPSVERVLQALGPTGLPRPHVVAVVRRVLEELRSEGEPAEFAAVLTRVAAAMDSVRRTRLQPVVNATGVLLHTNFGRAPLSAAAVRAVSEVAANYCNVEFDLDAGKRGGRAVYLERSLALLCGAEAATVVNNCAAALVLALRHYTATRRQVVISRGELVQIGGGFRIPDILESSGAVLREVGTTNRTTIDDYARAIGPETGLILKVHRSNFFMDGFVGSPPTDALAGLAREHHVPFVEDLGSGAVFATEAITGLEHEPTPSEILRRGVDLVTFSGDKLLGGPQAGIIAGKSAAVGALKQEPFFRALRCDKLVFAALQATVDDHLHGGAAESLPLQMMARAPLEALRARGAAMLAALSDLPVRASCTDAEAEIGGGSLPRSRLASVAVELSAGAVDADELCARLSRHVPPVIATIGHDKVRIDLRTVFPAQDAIVVAAIQSALATPGVP